MILLLACAAVCLLLLLLLVVPARLDDNHRLQEQPIPLSDSDRTDGGGREGMDPGEKRLKSPLDSTIFRIFLRVDQILSYLSGRCRFLFCSISFQESKRS